MNIKSTFFYFFLVNLIFATVGFSQDITTLNIGDNAPGLVLTSTNNSIQSFSFPYQNRITLLFFWSSTVSKSKENIYRYKRIYNKYSDVGYKSADGFDMISVALQSDKITWGQDLTRYGLMDMNSCISLKGYNDMFVKGYKISSTPSSFLIDENGKIISINPSIKSIIEYLDSKRNVELNTEVQTKISGKVMFGNGPQQALSNEKIWFMNGNDTIKSTQLDEKGRFLLDNINALLSLNVFVKANDKITEEQTVFLTSENGEIVSSFTKNEIGYEYTILDAEIPYLKPFSENSNTTIPLDKSLKNLYFTQQLFTAKEIVLSKEAMSKINSLVSKLKENPKTKLEILAHSDSNGDSKTNLGITQKQANAIASYLVSKGIDKNRLKAVGKGEDEIINKCKDGVKCSDIEHKENRRIEFKFYPL